MSRPPSISDAEWQVMEIIWQRNPIAANQVVDALAGRTRWNPRTIKTMLNRLVNKGALAFEREGKRYLYRPRISREESVKLQSRSFLSRVFGGEAGPLLVHFVEQAELSPAEIRQLKRILSKKGK